ncbi:aspartic proteinase CDR1-like [Prosopis cineraria]|uniref:aspartic proteinase CDR1-like n=1 Tax=Prosopis cineraria TaxID=364024 RepID=UPI00240F2301|nr:aspartic proteinase CDR1-like [Prosopis cineraria]
MNISIGTPPFEVLGIADTLVILHGHTCSPFAYEDGSGTSGVLSSDTFTIGIENPVSLWNIAFGCAHDITRLFDGSMSSLVGLRGGKISFVSQLGKSLGIKRFLYCPVPVSSTLSNVVSSSIMSLGSDAVVSGPSDVTTRIVSKGQGTFYYLTLDGMSVGNKRVPYKDSTVVVHDNDHDAVNETEGNVIIDLGTTLTFLPSEFFADLVMALEEAIDGEKVDDPKHALGLCSESSTVDNLNIPILMAHFKGGDVEL